jgi:hypothetical protein
LRPSLGDLDDFRIGLHRAHEVESIGRARFGAGTDISRWRDCRPYIASIGGGQLVLETERAKPIPLLQQLSASSEGY